jgi:hypothetical protein
MVNYYEFDPQDPDPSQRRGINGGDPIALFGRLGRWPFMPRSPHFLLAPREGGALSQLPRTAACEAQADEWIAKRSFYRINIVAEDDNRDDIGIYDPNTSQTSSPPSAWAGRAFRQLMMLACIRLAFCLDSRTTECRLS